MNIETNSISALNATSKARGSATLDQTSFLKLMTTQLQTQDPFAPQDSTQMVAQMAQFSQVSGNAEMNTTLKSIATKLDALIAAQTPKTGV
jgi:flagellar basal-body rod modification protein FlgD